MIRALTVGLGRSAVLFLALSTEARAHLVGVLLIYLVVGRPQPAESHHSLALGRKAAGAALEGRRIERDSISGVQNVISS